MAVTDAQLTQRLHELIEALDRRVPRVGHAGEISIARDAAALRTEAVNRLAELADQHTAEAVVTPDRSGQASGNEPG